jgi:hypothetical protein
VTLLAAGAVVAALGCTGYAERPLLDRFFELSRLRDRTALQQIATVVFEPLQDGIVTSFDITQVTSSEERAGRVTKNVVVRAAVKLPGGPTVQKTLVVALERTPRGWIVTGILSRQT